MAGIFPHQPTVGPNCANLKGHHDNNDTMANITLRQHWLLLATFETNSSDIGSNKPLIFAVSIKLVTLLFLREKERNHLWILSDSFHAKSSHLQLLTDSVHSAHILRPDARAETVPELTRHLVSVSVLLFGSYHLILFVSSTNSIQIVRRQCCLCQIWCTIELHRDLILKVLSEW